MVEEITKGQKPMNKSDMKTGSEEDPQEDPEEVPEERLVPHGRK